MWRLACLLLYDKHFICERESHKRHLKTFWRLQQIRLHCWHLGMVMLDIISKGDAHTHTNKTTLISQEGRKKRLGTIQARQQWQSYVITNTKCLLPRWEKTIVVIRYSGKTGQENIYRRYFRLLVLLTFTRPYHIVNHAILQLSNRTTHIFEVTMVQ